MVPRISGTFTNWDNVFVPGQLKTSFKWDFAFDFGTFEHFAIFERLKYSNVLEILKAVETIVTVVCIA